MGTPVKGASRAPYDPEAHGARCGSCPLRDKREEAPCPPESRPAARFAIIGEAPGGHECEEGRPFVGPSGVELARALKAADLRRSDAHITNVLLCRPPGNDLKKFHAGLKIRNRRRKAKGLPPWPTPESCCAPRLADELRHFDLLLTVGDAPAKALIPGHRAGILGVRGGPVWAVLDGDPTRAGTDAARAVEDARRLDATAAQAPPPADPFAPAQPTFYSSPASTGWTTLHADAVPTWPPGQRLRKILPTLHPAFVLRYPRWREAFQADVARARRLFAPGPTGKLTWADPKMVFRPSVNEVRRFLAPDPVTGRGKPYAFDFEADSKEPLACTVRCIGIGDADKVLVIPFASCEPDKAAANRDKPWRAFYSDKENQELRALLHDWALDPKCPKVGWNCLFAGTPVILADGTSRPIEEIVRGRQAVSVLGLDATGQIVPTRVVGWWRTKAEGQSWLVVRAADEKGGARGLTVTPDHEVYTTRGRVEAQHLRPGDQILVGERQLQPEEEDAILGTLLGDSTPLALTSEPREGRTPRALRLHPQEARAVSLRGGHVGTLAQEKSQWLGGLLTCTPATRQGGYANSAPFTTFRSPQLRQIKHLACRVYPPGERQRLSWSLLDSLGPAAFAWWYADDGFVNSRRHDGSGIGLSTCRYTADDVEAAAGWFTFNFGPTSVSSRRCLLLSVEATRNFCQRIAPFLLPAARYKLPPATAPWPDFLGFPPRPATPSSATVASVTPWEPRNVSPTFARLADTRWCLTTETGNFLTGFGFVKNSGYYDSLVFQSWLDLPQGKLAGHTDGIMVQRLVEPAMPHALAHVGSMLTDAWRWKGGKEGTTAQKDENLWSYNARDVSVTARVVPPYLDKVKVLNLRPLLDLDHEAQDWARGMHTQGMLVDQVERERLDVHYTAREAFWRAEATRLAHELGGSTSWGQKGPKKAPKFSDHNPGSPTHVAKLLYDLCGLEPLVYSETSGTASVGDGALRALHYAGALAKDPRLADYVHAVRRFRAHSKFVSSYMKPLRPLPEGTPSRGIGPDGRGVYGDGGTYELEAALDTGSALGDSRDVILAAARGDREALDEAREALGLDYLEGQDTATRDSDRAGSYWDLPDTVREALSRRCIVHPDGRIHPDWKTHVVPTGRYATSPNVQNWPGKIRSIIIAGPGRVLVSVDASQLELRVAASRWRAQGYLEAFAKGWDVHQVTMHAINKDTMWDFPGWVGPVDRRFFKDGFKGSTVFDVQRDLAKRVQYAGQYGANILTVFDVISSAEDKYGRLLYPKLTPAEVAVMVEAWKSGCPEFEAGWQMELDFWKAHGFLQEYVTGRRWDFPDGEDLNKMVNAPIQGSGAGIVNSGTKRVVAKFPFGYAGPGTGLINQGHDALTFEVPEADADRCLRAALACLRGSCPALPGVDFEAEGGVSKRWKKPAELIEN